MAIVINGSGTVTGISVGGLPDGIVDSGTLATNSVDSAELIDGAVDDSHMAAMAASKLTGALPAISGASLTGLSAVAGTCTFQAKFDDSAWTSMAADVLQVFNEERYDADTVYNTSTGYFTAPAAGNYFFYAGLYVGEDDISSGFAFAKNGSYSGIHGDENNYGCYMSQYTPADVMTSMQLVIPLAASDTIGIKSTTQSDLYTGHSYWGGFRLS